MKIPWKKLTVLAAHSTAGFLLKHGLVHVETVAWMQSGMTFVGAAIAGVVGWLVHNPPPAQLKQDLQTIGKQGLAVLLMATMLFAGQGIANAQTAPPVLTPPSVVIDGQTNALPTTPVDFIKLATSYFSTVNTNLSWANTKMDLWTAVNYQSGLQVSDEIGVSYDAVHLSTNAAGGIVLAPEAIIRNAGIAGTIVSFQGGAGVSYEYWDLKLTGYVDGGYSPAVGSSFAEVGARVKKKMTVSTYAGFGLAYQYFFKTQFNQKLPSLAAFLGRSF